MFARADEEVASLQSEWEKELVRAGWRGIDRNKQVEFCRRFDAIHARTLKAVAPFRATLTKRSGGAL